MFKMIERIAVIEKVFSFLGLVVCDSHYLSNPSMCGRKRSTGRVLNAKEDNEYNQLWFKSKIKTYPNMVQENREKKQKTKRMCKICHGLAFIESVRGKRLDGVSFILKETRN